MFRHLSIGILAATLSQGSLPAAFSQEAKPDIPTYSSRIKSAHKELKAGNTKDARKTLALTSTRLRGWEHAYLLNLAAQLEKKANKSRYTLDGDGAVVETVAFTPDGRRLIVGSTRKNVAVWDFVNGKSSRLVGHAAAARAVAVSPDGKTYATGGWDGKVFVWDAAKRKKLLEYRGHNLPNTPPGDSQTTTVRSVRFSPDGKQIVSVAFGNSPFVLRLKCEVKVWSVATGKTLLTLKGEHTKSRALSIVFATYSPDGKTIATGGYDKKLKLWDAKTGKRLRVIAGHTNNVLGIAFSPDGKRVATASTDRTLAVWDAATGKELLRLKGHKGPVFSVAFAPDGKRIVSGCWDKTVRLWHAETGTQLLNLGKLPGPVRTIAVSPDGKRIAAGGGAPGRIADATVWDSSPAKAKKDK